LTAREEQTKRNRGKRFSKCGRIHNPREAHPIGGEWRKRLAASTQMPARIPGIDGGYGEASRQTASSGRTLSPPYLRG